MQNRGIGGRDAVQQHADLLPIVREGSSAVQVNAVGRRRFRRHEDLALPRKDAGVRQVIRLLDHARRRRFVAAVQLEHGDVALAVLEEQFPVCSLYTEINQFLCKFDVLNSIFESIVVECLKFS